MLALCGFVSVGTAQRPPGEMPATQVITPPRVSAPFSLRELWRTTPATLLYPTDLHFARHGLLVYDHGDKSVHVLEARNGRQRGTIGRGGRGPGEFSGGPGVFLGTSSAPLVLEYGNSRMARIDGMRIESVRTFRGREWWFSGCTWGQGRVVRETTGAGTLRPGGEAVISDLLVFTVGDSSALVDSLPIPWSRLAGLERIVRQAQIRQLDDSTCVLLPLYHREFAVLRPGSKVQLGIHIEALPPAQLRSTKEGKAIAKSVAPGARRGGIDGRSWREHILILFVGQNGRYARVIDLYERRTLRYAGSIALPFPAERLAVSGDTLAVIGQVDLEPLVAAFLIAAPAPRRR